MHKKLEVLSKEEMVDIVDNMLDEMRRIGNSTQYEHFKDMVECKIYTITPTKANEIVGRMRPSGELFSMDNVRNMLSNNGILYDEKKCVEYYLCMNMYANDARRVAEENGMPLDKFCYVMAKSFIEDEDAPKYKVEKYFDM